MFELCPKVKVLVPTLILSGTSERHTAKSTEMALLKKQKNNNTKTTIFKFLVFWTIAKAKQKKACSHCALE